MSNSDLPAPAPETAPVVLKSRMDVIREYFDVEKADKGFNRELMALKRAGDTIGHDHLDDLAGGIKDGTLTYPNYVLS